MKEILARLLGAIRDIGNLTEIDGLSISHSDNNVPNFLCRFQKTTCFYGNFCSCLRKRAGGILPVGLLQHRNDSGGSETATGESHRIKEHTHLSFGSSDNKGLTDHGHLLDRVLNLCCQSAQGQMIILFAMKGDGQNRHIINRLHLHQGYADSRRNTVEVGTKLLRKSHKAFIRILSYLESSNHTALTRTGCGVNIFNPRNLPEQFFHGAGGPFFHLLRTESRHLCDDIDHRHLDLRLFLSWKHQDCKKPKQQGSDNNERRQFGVDEYGGNAPCNTSMIFLMSAHGAI